MVVCRVRMERMEGEDEPHKPLKVRCSSVTRGWLRSSSQRLSKFQTTARLPTRTRNRRLLITARPRRPRVFQEKAICPHSFPSLLDHQTSAIRPSLSTIGGYCVCIKHHFFSQHCHQTSTKHPPSKFAEFAEFARRQTLDRWPPPVWQGVSVLSGDPN